MPCCHKLITVFLVLYTLFGINENVEGQEGYMSRTFTTNDGLAHNFVQSICQDNTGFIWAATWDGLSRFDGTEFENFYCNPSDSSSLPFFCIDKVLIDHFGNLLVYCLNRTLSIYNPVLNRFEPFNINGKKVTATGIEIDKHGNTWITSKGTIYLRKVTDTIFKTVKVVNENFDQMGELCRYISIDNKGEIWIYTNTVDGTTIYKGIQVNDSLIKLENIKPLSQKKYKSFGLRNSDQLSFYQSKSNNIWMFSKYGLFLYNPKQKEFITYTAKIDPKEFEGRPYFTWIDEKKGANIIDTEKKVHFTIKADPGQYFETVFIDRQQTVWIGTISSLKDDIGLNRYIKIPNYFKHYLTEKNENNESNHVTPILKDRFGDIWAGTKSLNYLYQIKPDGKIKKIRYLNQAIKGGPSKPNSMVADSTGIWIGCSNNNLIFYDFQLQKYILKVAIPLTSKYRSDPILIHNVLKIKDKIIINCGNCIYSFDIRQQELKYEYSVYSTYPAYTLVSDSKEGYWIGSYAAYLFRLNSGFKTDTMFRFLNREEVVQHIVPGDNNDVWIALQGGGLGHKFLKSGKSELFTTTNGLSNNTLYSILKDKEGRLWLSNDKGISVFNPKNKQFRNFGHEDGIKIEDFTGDSYFLTPDGEMFFGGVNGIVSFYPEEIMNIKEPVSPLVITGFSVSGNPRYFHKPVNELSSVKLEKGENNFNVSFASLNFKDDLKIKYRNRLIGVSDSWKETDGKNRTIGYFNLTPGTYKLEIEASDKNGNWDSKTSLTIIIPFRIYETLWFRVFCVLVVLVLLSSWIRIYIKQIRFRARQEQEELRLEALRNQMNPHFIFNSLNSINYFISKNDKLSANHYIADFSRLIRSFLTNLSNDFIPLETEIQLLTDYLNLESLRFGDKFTYTLRTDNLSQTMNCNIFPGIVQPFIENAIWHGMSGLENRIGHIEIHFELVNNILIKCVIEDNGIGRNLAGSYRSNLPRKKSRGIGIILERLNLHNKHHKTNYQVVVTDLYPERPETGTRVVVDIPLEK